MSKEAILVQKGQKIDYALTADVVVGDVVPFGTEMISVACSSGLTGEVIAVDTECVYEINAVASTAIDIGDEVFFNAAAREITKSATGNARAGRAVSSKAAVAGTILVKLNAA